MNKQFVVQVVNNLLKRRQGFHLKWAYRRVHTMRKWQIHQYGGVEEMMLTETARVPAIQKPDELLIKVQAASVNPIDTIMIGGYGSTALNQIRKAQSGWTMGSEFPLTVGRDFCGYVVDTGRSPLAAKYKPGDQVWGAIRGTMPGTHSEYIVAYPKEISKKPHNLNYIEAASIPYVACTVWAALCTVGELSAKSTAGKRVLVHAGSGGIGTFAIQLLKAWGAEVTTTCSTDAVDMVRHLGADNVINYKATHVQAELEKVKGFDLILDPLGGDTSNYSMDLLRNYVNAKYIDIATPLVKNMDKYGLNIGLALSLADLGLNAVKGFSRGRSYRWAFFIPNGKALTEVAELVEDGLIKPVIDQVFPFSEAPAAFRKVIQKHGRGKTVLDVDGSFSSETNSAQTEGQTGG